MFAIAFLFVCVLCDCFKSRRRLEAEILVLRHQLNVLQQRAPRRFPWDTAPKYLIHDNDRAFGGAFQARVRAMGIRDPPTSFPSPFGPARVH